MIKLTYLYKRLKSRKPMFKGKRGKTKTRTFSSANDRKDWEDRIRRRNRLKEVERVMIAFKEIADDPIWKWLN